MVVVPAETLYRYRYFSLYNSPYPAHDSGAAIDLYPETETAPSPVAGEVVDTRTVRAPPKPYAAVHDHLILIDTGRHTVRILHVDPTVDAGDTVDVGTPLGTLVRSGFFAPWVENHIHLGFRPPDANPYRATGSLRITTDHPIIPVPWDGTGRVRETGDTYCLLDTPGHPNPGGAFAGIAAGTPEPGVIDGGCPHYEGGGLLRTEERTSETFVTRLIDRVDGRTIQWADVEIRANGTPVTGLSFAIHRDRLAAKLVSWDGIPARPGDPITVTLHHPSPRSPDPPADSTAGSCR